MESLVTIVVLITCIHYGEPMVSNQKHVEHKKIHTADPHPIAKPQISFVYDEDEVAARKRPGFRVKPKSHSTRFLKTNQKAHAKTNKIYVGKDVSSPSFIYTEDMQDLEKDPPTSLRKGRLARKRAPASKKEVLLPPPEDLTEAEDENVDGASGEGGPSFRSFGRAGDEGDGSVKAAEEETNESENETLPVEIADRLTSILCSTLIEEGYLPSDHKHNEESGLATSFMWVPVRQYIPGFGRGILVDPPVFATGCFKWRLRKCGGDEIWPMMRPCTFWAPMPIRNEACGYHTGNKEYKYVVGRPEEMIPGHCACDWPCIPYFDPFQRCRVPAELKITDDKTLTGPYKISHNQAVQLCRGVAQVYQTAHPTRIPMIPIRIANPLHEDQEELSCFSWIFTACDEEDIPGCGVWTKSEESENNCLKEEVAPRAKEASEEEEEPPRIRKKSKYRKRIDRGSAFALDGSVCLCQFPCLPWYDPINKCYDQFGKVMVDERGKNYLPPKNYLSLTDEGFFQCTKIEEDITCAAIINKDPGQEPRPRIRS